MTDQGATPMKGWHIDGYDTRVQNWGTDEELTVEEVEKRLDDYAHLLEVERAAKEMEKYIVALYDGGNDRVDSAFEDLPAEMQERLRKADEKIRAKYDRKQAAALVAKEESNG